MELDRLLDSPEVTQPRPTRRSVKRQVKDSRSVAQLEEQAQRHPVEAKVVAHICATFRQRWPRLFACYAWPACYRTNNDMETFFGRLRTRQRQIHGRKSVHEFTRSVRYGEWAVFIDPTETLNQVLQRFQQFDQAGFDQEYAHFLKAQRRLQVLYRFRHTCTTARCVSPPALSQTIGTTMG